MLSGVKFTVPIGSVPSRNTLLLVTIVYIICFGCQHPPQVSDPPEPYKNASPCAQIEAQIDLGDRIETLRTIAQAFYDKCYEVVITYGTQAQADYKYKTFSVTKEVSNIFLPDGTWTDYVLESYERGFLNVLLALSYYRVHNVEASTVELRSLDHEIFTPLYNYGADPVNLLFSAVLWEMLGEHHEAWVDWNRLQRQEGLEETIQTFASHRLNGLKAEEKLSGDWEIYAIGSFPAVDWEVKFRDTANGYFSVTPQGNFPPECSSESGVRISTNSWFRKIAMRHNPGYHPLLHAQSWLRLPIGVLYSITTFSAGASIAMGGCFADAYGRGGGSICRLSIAGGMALIRESPKVLRHTLRPDLRHWDNVPSSFLFTTASDIQNERCWIDVSDQDQRPTIKIFDRHDIG